MTTSAFIRRVVVGRSCQRAGCQWTGLSSKCPVTCRVCSLGPRLCIATVSVNTLTAQAGFDPESYTQPTATGESVWNKHVILLMLLYYAKTWTLTATMRRLKVFEMNCVRRTSLKERLHQEFRMKTNQSITKGILQNHIRRLKYFGHATRMDICLKTAFNCATW